MKKLKQTASSTKVSDQVMSLHYRWEFLRRGERYQVAFQDFAAKYGDWIKCELDSSWLNLEPIRRGEDPRIISRNNLASMAMTDLQDFRTKWGIDPRDPESGRSPFLNHFKSPIVGVGPATSVWTGNPNDGIGEPNVISIHIDLQRPFVEIMTVLNWWIRTERSRRNLKDKDQKQRRNRYDHFNFYLIVFDLRKKKKKFPEIAKELFPENLGDPVKRAMDYYSKAKSLILKAQKGIW